MDYDTTYFATLLSIAYSVINDVLSWFGIGSSISGGETSSCPYEVLGLQDVKDTCTIDDVNKARRKVSGILNVLYIKYNRRICWVVWLRGFKDMHLVYFY